MQNVLFIFIDGVGLAPAGEDNPLAQASMPTLRRLLGGAPTTELGRVLTRSAALVPLDATLGMPGLPQSGTGQATLMTGENCALLHGGHFGPYPPSIVRSVLKEKNIFSRCAALGLSFEFANAYPQRYFDYLAAHPALKATIASSFEMAGKTLHTVDDLKSGYAISADVVSDRWSDLGHDSVPKRTPHEAGARLAEFSRDNAFTMFEFWMTDKAGHKQDMNAACAALDLLDGLIEGVTDAFDDRMLLVITSDHGNMEDLSVHTHTRNPVPLIVIGAGAVAFAESAVSLMDVAPRIISALIESS